MLINKSLRTKEKGFAFYISKTEAAGFTLVELLIVIAILTIMGGVVLSVLNPAKQQRRAQEAVLRETTDKLCFALKACATATDNRSNCNEFPELLVNDPSASPVPVGATYTIGDLRTTEVAIFGELPAGSGNVNVCTFLCSFDFSNGSSVETYDFHGTCL